MRKAFIKGYLIGGWGLALAIYLTCMHFVDSTHVGIQRNLITGQNSLSQPGLHFTAPWVLVAQLPHTPVRVCITSASRSGNCKLVEFNPEHYKEFIATEGFRYYWWDNRISFNSGYETYRGYRDLYRGYAFGMQAYPFITIHRSFDAYSK